MRLTAIRNKRPQANAIISSGTIAAPTKGWYAGANLSEAPPGTAYLLENAFPQYDYVRSRRGSIPWATGMGSSVSSLMNWTDGVSSKVFAATVNGKIFDVTSSGAVGAALVTGLNNGSFEWLQHRDAGGGSWLVAVNGADPVQFYNGASWVTAPAWTGTGFTSLSHIWTFKGILFGVQTNSRNAWYLPVATIGGAATLYQLGQFFKWGGRLLCGGTWAIDSTSGVFEFCVFISTEGEVLVYDGADPTTWILKGTYKISRPLGVRCLMRAGGDLGIMTEDGIVPMSKVETLDQVALQNAAVTFPIAPAWRQAVVDRTGLTGWQIVLWPLESMAVINLPKSNASDRTQFVANARTGAWARYTGWDANCFVVTGNNLNNSVLFYGTTDGRTMQAETSGQDDGNAYTTTIFPRFEHLGQLEPAVSQATSYSSVINKQLRMVRLNLFSDTPFVPQLTARVDYDTTIPTFPGTSYLPFTGALWDVALWDVDVWPPTTIKELTWMFCSGFGAVHSPVMQWTISQSTSAPDIRLTAIDMAWESGNLLG